MIICNNINSIRNKVIQMIIKNIFFHFLISNGGVIFVSIIGKGSFSILELS
jgi:hypothetical protein